MTRLIVGPFNRVEGDLEVILDVADGAVREARVKSSLYRGFEQILQGKAPLDALVFVPRICGICSVSQSAAASQALASAMGIKPPDNGRLAANLIQASENVADHVTHFYLFFMPDFARDCYKSQPWWHATSGRFKAVTGSAAGDFLPARAGWMRAMGLLAGKWPHTLTLQPGGSTHPINASERLRLLRVLREFRAFLERITFGDTLETVAAITSANELASWAERHAGSDFGLFLRASQALNLRALGHAGVAFMSYGAYEQPNGRWWPAGVWAGGPALLDPTQIAEDVSHAWYADAEAPLPPQRGSTLPIADKDAAYTWCKAPRLGGEVVETGALARQLVAGHPLAHDLVARDGGGVEARVVARLLEVARLVPAMETWAEALRPGEPFSVAGELPAEAEGMGLVEAARGSLGHWLSIRRGRLHNYQIIAPTTWNFSPRDSAGRPGALERALVGVPVGEGEKAPASVQHIVRSFDPCMVCTVH
ncbi:MAG: nickel-dependent hydrogenase large subunit [Gammaproteobacteria bacterium]|nr:nickel-dependent hydrogenase large subunit [Gammaproteobacteria bacterium]MBU1416553.1 nickel-dependent hydrogenase large subunit [Gammaproteobacteria bacterium]